MYLKNQFDFVGLKASCPIFFSFARRIFNIQKASKTRIQKNCGPLG